MNIYEAAQYAQVQAERCTARAERERNEAEMRPKYVPALSDIAAGRKDGALARAVASFRSLEVTPAAKTLQRAISSPTIPARRPMNALVGSQPRGTLARCAPWTHKCSTPGCSFNAAWTKNGVHACNQHYQALEGQR